MVRPRHVINYDVIVIPVDITRQNEVRSWGFTMGIPQGMLSNHQKLSLVSNYRWYTRCIFRCIFAFILQINTLETKLFEFLCFSSSFWWKLGPNRTILSNSKHPNRPHQHMLYNIDNKMDSPGDAQPSKFSDVFSHLYFKLTHVKPNYLNSSAFLLHFAENLDQIGQF